MSYDEKILDVKTKFLIALKRDLSKKPANKKVDQDEFRRIVYKFVFNQIKDNIKNKKNMEEYCWEILWRATDFCLSYGFIIINTLDDIKKIYCRDLKMYEKEKSESIDA